MVKGIAVIAWSEAGTASLLHPGAKHGTDLPGG